VFSQLPRAGGVLDQSARLMYVFEAINMAESERELRDAERRKKEAQRAGNRP